MMFIAKYDKIKQVIMEFINLFKKMAEEATDVI